MAKPLVIVESPAKAKTIAGYPRQRLHGDGERRAHPRPARGARTRCPTTQKRDPRPPRGIDPDDHFDACLRRARRQEEGRRRAEGGAEGRRRAHPRDRRGPRGRGDRLARARGAAAQGAGEAHGVPRDHAARDPRGARQPARPRHEARRGAGGPPHARPPRRLGDVAGVVARVRRAARPRRPDGCRASPCAWSSSASGPACAFRSGQWTTSRARSSPSEPAFRASLVELDGKRLAEGRDFDPATGAIARRAPTSCCSTPTARPRSPTAARRAVHGRVGRDPTRSPSGPRAPFTTSTLQQESGRKLRFSAARTMAVAQRLYERGYITYMRTDSTNLSEQAISAARDRDPRAVRRGVPARRAARVPQQGEERAGGARGDPAGRRSHPHARRGARRARRPTSSGSTS